MSIFNLLSGKKDSEKLETTKISSDNFGYHYTSTAGANAIRKDKMIRSRNGVMLSKLKPEEHTRDSILHSIHGNSIPDHCKNRADNVVFVDLSSLDCTKLYEIKPDLYKYSGDIKINAVNVRDKPACTNRGGGSTWSQSGSTSGTSSSGSSSSLTFYFYTNEKTASKIKYSGYIASNNRILLTTLKPEYNYRNEILKVLYGGIYDQTQYATSADWCVKIDGTKLYANKLKKRQNDEVYEYYDSISVNSADVRDKPRCTMGGHSSNGSSSVVRCQDIQYSQVSIIGNKSGYDTNIHHNQPIYSNENYSTQMELNNCIVKIHVRSDIKYDTKSDQDENVTIFAFEWLKDGLEIIRTIIGKKVSLDIRDSSGYSIQNDLSDFSMKDLQAVARNESSNTNGEINFGNFIGISNEVVYSLKDLVRQTVIVGSDYTTNYGGYPHDIKRVRQDAKVYICDLIGLQFQQTYNTGRLVTVGENVPKGLLDDFIYRMVVNEEKPTVDQAKKDTSGRFEPRGNVFFDIKAYTRFVANDVFITGMALNQCANEAINFKFLKYGTGYFAGPFRDLLERYIGTGVLKGLQKLLGTLTGNHHIKRIELPFFNADPGIDEICARHNVELVYGRDDGLRKTHSDYTTATTNCADPHAMTGNKMGFSSIDGTIAENIQGKAIKFSPIINKLMKERFIKQFQ